jgi:hypothetical protein
MYIYIYIHVYVLKRIIIMLYILELKLILQAFMQFIINLLYLQFNNFLYFKIMLKILLMLSILQ